MKKLLLILLAIVGCTGCSTITKNKKNAYAQEEPTDNVINLNSSATIIMQLIGQEKLDTILVDADSEGIDILIKNFSPAQLALEAEVLNYNAPVIVIFNDHEDIYFMNLIKKYAQAYPAIKFVHVDSEKLFTIAQQSQVDTFPTAMIIHDRQEMNRCEGFDECAALGSLIEMAQKIIAK